MILDAWQHGKQLSMTWINRAGELDRAVCWPDMIEYDRYEDKMRMMARVDDHLVAVVLGRIQSCEYSDPADYHENELHTNRHLPVESHLEDIQKSRVNVRENIESDLPVLFMQIIDEDNALERTLAVFGHYQKKDFRCEKEKQYILEIYIDPFEEIDDIIDSILYLGSYIKLLGPQNMVENLKVRLVRQLKMFDPQG